MEVFEKVSVICWKKQTNSEINCFPVYSEGRLTLKQQKFLDIE